MPKIVIWMPRKENEAGHVGIATNEYYVSFWPANCLEKDGKLTSKTIFDGIEFAIEVHKGCLVFHQDLDKEYEGDVDNKPRDPDCEHEIDAAKVSNEDLNAEIEEFLRYNEIDPEDVTLAKGEEKYQKYKQLSALLTPEEAERIEDLPVKSLAKTKYSIVTELVSSKDDDSASFYNSHQSCVSLAFNLIQMAWLKLHPDQPIPIVHYDEITKASDELTISSMAPAVTNILMGEVEPKKFAYKVPWFEKEVVQSYLITDWVNDQPKISTQLKIDQVLRQVGLTFVMFLLGYFFPETAYPNLFIYFNFVIGIEVIPSTTGLFIHPLFIILMAHHWCGLVLSVVIVHVGFFLSYAIIIFWDKKYIFFVEFLSVIRICVEALYKYCREVIGHDPTNVVDFFRVLVAFFRRIHQVRNAVYRLFMKFINNM